MNPHLTVPCDVTGQVARDIEGIPVAWRRHQVGTKLAPSWHQVAGEVAGDVGTVLQSHKAYDRAHDEAHEHAPGRQSNGQEEGNR